MEQDTVHCNTTHTDPLVSNDSDNMDVQSNFDENKNQELVSKKTLKENQISMSYDAAEYEGDGDEENENILALEKMYYPNAKMGICNICQFCVNGHGNTGRTLMCSNGHLICHRCVRRYSIQTETNCVLCVAMGSRQSISSDSPRSDNSHAKHKKKIFGPKPRTRRKEDNRDAVYYKPKTTASCNNISSYYNVGMSYGKRYVESWNDSDNERTNEEDNDTTHVHRQINQEHYYKVVHEVQLKSTKKAQINSQMISECSRRPIQCPLAYCSVNVAFSSLTNHFIYDHPEVLILTVEPDEKRTLIINFHELVYDSSHCLALLLVSGKLSGLAAKQFSGNNVHQKYKNQLPLPILAARLHCDALHNDNSSPSIHNEAYNNGGDVVIAWVAGLDFGNSATGTLRYSIQAIDRIDSEAFRSLTYTGPINSLRTAQKPREIFLTGDCVTIHNGFINQITSGSEKLNFNVIIH